MRENIKSVGLILAIAIAGVSLPVGIIGFNKDANNYYTNNYYTTNNNTTIINNNTTIINNNNTYPPEPEPDYTQPLRTSVRNNTFEGHMQIRTFEVSSGYMYRWFFNSTGYRFGHWSAHASFELYIVGDSWLPIFLSGYFAIAHKKQNIGESIHNGYYSIPYHDTWHFIYYQSDDTWYGGTDIVPSNYTMMDEILKI